jgi:hypothetical protein
MTDVPVPTAAVPEIEELRNENAKLLQSISEVKRQMTSHLVMAELKAEAMRAGIIDLDVLRLLDLEAAKVDEHHNVLGVPEMIEKFKERKPYLFRSKSSSTPTSAPPAQPMTRKRAVDMTDEEYQAARSALLRQNR